MIGRFSRSLGWKPHAPIVAGTILPVLGVWQGADPLLSGYPSEAELIPVTGFGVADRRARHSVGQYPAFSGGPVSEFRAVLEPGTHPVLYRSNPPAYGEIKPALEGEVTAQMRPDAGDAFDRMLIWGLAAGNVTIAPAADIVATLRQIRGNRAMFGAVLAIAGLAFVVFGVLRRRQTDGRIQC